MPLSLNGILHDRYRIEKLLGQGGMGAVYRAWDTSLDIPVAVKENKTTTPEAQKQFTREAQLLARLSHPNLPRVIDYFLVPDEGQYLVMDFVEGEDLESMLARLGRLPEPEVLQWISQVCEALAYLHHQPSPIIHRDIKPANIKIRSDGRAMLVDFGIAKIYDASMATTIGARAVTPGFSPPEQYGLGGTDAASDLYALGATLYMLLTGNRPPDSLEMMMGSATPPPPAHEVNPSVPIEVSTTIQRAMQLSRSRRLTRVDEFKASLATTKQPGEKPVPIASVTPPIKPPVSPPAHPVNAGQAGARVVQPSPPPYKPPAGQVPALATPAVPAQKPKSRIFCSLITGLALGMVVMAVICVGVVLWLSNYQNTVVIPKTQTAEALAAENYYSEIPTTFPWETPTEELVNILPVSTLQAPGFSMSILGQSAGSRPIPMIQVGYGSKPIIIVGNLDGMQADTNALLEQLIADYQNSSQLIPNDAALYIIPTLNPDGMESGTGFNDGGVILNRNFGADNWTSDPTWPGKPEGIAGSGGSEPFSEPETQALRDLALNLSAQDPRLIMVFLYSSDTFTARQVMPGHTNYGVDTFSDTLAQKFTSDLAGEYVPYWSSEVTGEPVNWAVLKSITAINLLIPSSQPLTSEEFRNAISTMIAFQP